MLLILATAGVSCASRQEASPSLATPSLRWVPDASSPRQASVEARGVDWGVAIAGAVAGPDVRDPGLLLLVYARPTSGGATDATNPTPPMLGSYEVMGRVMRFRPAFPLDPRMKYEAVLDLRSLPRYPNVLKGVLTATYVPPPAPAAPESVVAHVYPSADALPENLLKFYVHFSAPMSRGGVYRHVRLIDDSGRDVELPFLELDEELWDPDMTRLTLFIDPGRIKRGVRPLEEIGPALEQGRRYTLVIGPGLVDATGRELAGEFRKRFTVGPPDRESPDPGKWKVTAPAPSTRGPVSVEFPEPLDAALAERLIRVTAGGRVVPGHVALGDGERLWRFTPAEPWGAARYEILVQPTIEDLAGNNIGKPFEVDLEAGGEGRPALAPVRLPLEVR